MKINIVAVGKLKEKFWKDAAEEYAKRISRFAEFCVIEVPEKRTPAEEGAELIKKCRGKVYALDMRGKAITSLDLAAIIKAELSAGRSEFSFVIGGSEGFSDEVRAKYPLLSFGKVTYPHQLMRVILSEQIYRAFTVINGITYHK